MIKNVPALRSALVWLACIGLAFQPPVFADTSSPLTDPFNSQTPTISWQESNQAPESTSVYPELSSDLTSPLSLSTAGRSFYVSATGSDSGDGSEANPWQSIQRGVNQLEAGDTLFIGEGAYEEEVDMAASGNADAFITIQGVGNVILNGTNLPDYESAFDTKGRDYLRFVNLTINHYRAAVDVRPGSYFVEIDGLTADGNTYAVRIDGAVKVTVRNAYATNSNNAFRATGNSSDLLFEHIETYGSHDIFEGMDPDYLNGDGFIFESNVSDVVFRDIISADHWDAGFDIKASNVLIENAEVYGNKNNFKMSGNNITIKSSLSHHAKRQLRSNGTTVEGNGITVSGKNILLIQVTLADNEDHDVRIYSGGSLRIENGIVSRHDIRGKLFKNDGVFSSDRVLWNRPAEDYSNLKLSLTDFWGNPEFVDWSNANYRLKGTSLAIGYARTNGSQSSYDLDLNPRVEGPESDLGAYEFQESTPNAFLGIGNGDVVSGVIYVQPDRNTFPTLQSVTYSVDGKNSYTTKSNPYTWGGSKGYNTKLLKDGTHILKAVFQISSKIKKTYYLAFTVNNAAASTASSAQVTALQDDSNTTHCTKKSKSSACRGRSESR